MNTIAQHPFTTNNLSSDDFVAIFALKGVSVWDMKKYRAKKSDIVIAIIKANKVVSDFLKGA